MSVVDEQSEFVEQLMINEGMAVWEVALAVASVLLVLAELLHSVIKSLFADATADGDPQPVFALASP